MIQTKRPVSFDFLGYSFRPGLVPTKNGILLLTLPAMSQKSKNKVMEKIQEMKLFKRPERLETLAKLINEKTRDRHPKAVKDALGYSLTPTKEGGIETVGVMWVDEDQTIARISDIVGVILGLGWNQKRY
ncbi:hypothetical protein SIO70_01700 [Chitinophaga sancti]|uniref:hypothetical protein n=1 Tax=Chitinophaga sancti TaxID=1004 RepID=UPI002A7628AE|nr:hypothetical protein [Chitinophaga sancti]WPQ63579.1 hypothetical protein SIO70_01700 [Chitinophaga sancti]